MIDRGRLLFLLLAFCVAFTACGSRRLAREETDRLHVVEGRIAESERLGAMECAPRELAQAQGALALALHEMSERWEGADPPLRAAETASADLLAKAKACGERARLSSRATTPEPSPGAGAGRDAETAGTGSPGAGPAVSAPGLSLSLDNGTIERGRSANLYWSSTMADNVFIEPDIGPVEPNGNMRVAPDRSTTYTVTATGPGGSTTGTAMLKVTEPSPRASGALGEPRDEEVAASGTGEQGTGTSPGGGREPGAVGTGRAMEGESGQILFDFDRSAIRADAKPTLDEVAAHMKRNPGASLRIEGHCDERGTRRYNRILGQRRADSARDALVGMGVPRERITTISHGEDAPADPGHDEEAWAKNRRAVFRFR